MARPEKLRKVGCGAEGRVFKPAGRPMDELEIESMRLDELEALRLSDLEGLYQETAAARMGVSRPTFARILGRARTAVARALIEERALVVGEGPVVTAADEPFPLPRPRRRRQAGTRVPLPPQTGQARFWPRPELVRNRQKKETAR